uniref:Diterpene synthase n=1 Tax=Thuja plicata TaxID=3316 RepID=A0A7G6UAC0_THUPL|nr:diterpene synthase [Thuja plicata]
MSQSLCPRLSLFSKPTTKSTQRLSNTSLPFTNYARIKSIDCYNMTSAPALGDNAKTLHAAAIAHPEPKIYPNAGKPDYVHSNSTFEEAPLEEMDKRIEALVAEIKELFYSMEDGEISPSAYDTAWVARVPAIDASAQPQFPQLLDWILQNQLADGSWGQQSRFLASDRFLNTLACLLTLTFWGVGNNQVQRGLHFLRGNMEAMVKEAVAFGHQGFEMVLPALLNEAKHLGLDLPYELPIIQQINKKRDSELKKVSVEELHTHPTAMLQCLESIQEVVDWKDILKLQSKDGSFSGSPASTACVFMHTGDKKCLRFLAGLVTKFEDYVPCMYPVDIAERLRAVDSVERLGLERHFQTEIKQALDYVFQYWGERGVGFGRDSLVPDIDVTATGFRLLRMFGYTVSPDFLQNIKDEAEELCKLSDGENRGRVIDMLSLYRCSQINFPGENVMREIGAFAKDYLAESLQSNNFSQATAVKDNLRQEVEYALFARWNRNMPRLVIINNIEVFNPDDLWLGKTLYQMPNASNGKYLELAKLEFNRTQAIHRSEIQHIKRWYKACNFPQLEFTRHREVAIYWTAAAVMPDPQYTDCRLAYAKAGIMAVITDDLYDTCATLEQAKLFNEAFERSPRLIPISVNANKELESAILTLIVFDGCRWDTEQIEHLPEEMRIVFMGLYNTLREISEGAREVQGRDVLPYLRQKWLDLFRRYTKETEWMERRHSPSLEEYWENAVESIALGVTTLTPIFSTQDLLPDHLLQKFDFRADFLNLVSLTGRLINDVRTFQEERDRGELASCVQCYRNDNPGCTEEEALNYLYGVNEDALTKLNYQFLMREDIPKSFRTVLFNTARVMQLFYRNIDGFLNAAEEMKVFIKKTLYEPLL